MWFIDSIKSVYPQFFALSVLFCGAFYLDMRHEKYDKAERHKVFNEEIHQALREAFAHPEERE